MSESIKWESVIPNFQEGDIIRPFEGRFKRQRETNFIVDGGVDHEDALETCASVRRKDSQKVGIYNEKGEQILPEEFDYCEVLTYNAADFYVSAIRVIKDKFFGLYDEHGKMLVPVQYNNIYIKDYFIVVKDKNNLYGAYLTNGTKIIECENEYIEVEGSLDEGRGYAIVKQKGLYGVKSETGSEIVPVKFDYIKATSDGFIVSNNVSEVTKVKGWYSRNGKNSIPCLFESFEFQHKEIIAETSDGLKGVYSYDGKEIVPPKFKSINFIGDYIVGLVEDKILSVYDSKGTCSLSTIARLDEGEKFIIQFSSTVEVADKYIEENFGLKNWREKVMFLEENFNIATFNKPDEMTYWAALNAIIQVE